MKTTSYTCDWCKQPMPSDRMLRLKAEPAESFPSPLRIEAEICDDCCTTLEKWIASRGIGSEGEAVREPERGPAPQALNASEKLFKELAEAST